MLTLKVFAKLNLCLEVFSKQGEYHNLESAMMSVGIFDTVTIRQRKDTNVTVNDICGISFDKNIAFKAAKRFVDGFCLNGCDIHIEKGIPQASGLGGSSADAAAVVFGLMKLNGMSFTDEIKKLLNELGSDVLFMFFGGLAFVSGRGDKAEFVDFSHEYHFLVTTFDTKMSTREVFSKFDDCRKNGQLRFEAKGRCLSKDVVKAASEGTLNASMFFNGLEHAAKSISNYANDYLEFCNKNNLFPSMTGSGSAYFVLCKSFDDAQKTAKLLNSNGFSTVVASSKKCGIEVVL